MTDKPKRTRNANSPLGSFDAAKRIHEMRSTRAERLKALILQFEVSEQSDENKISNRVPYEQQGECERILRALDPQPNPGETIASTSPHVFPSEKRARA